MNYNKYVKLYKNDNHRRKDAFPEPIKAKRIATELSKRYSPGQNTIASQLRLAMLFNLSIPALIRFQDLMSNNRFHKYLPLTNLNEKDRSS